MLTRKYWIVQSIENENVVLLNTICESLSGTSILLEQHYPRLIDDFYKNKKYKISLFELKQLDLREEESYV